MSIICFYDTNMTRYRQVDKQIYTYLSKNMNANKEPKHQVIAYIYFLVGNQRTIIIEKIRNSASCS